jgi:hypothetical protein
MSDLIKNIIGKIKKEEIKPTPRWIFLLKRSVIIGLFILSILLGSIAVSIIFYQIHDADWDIYSKMDNNLLSFAVTALPYFWIILMIGFLALAYYNFHHTKTGYRHGVFAVCGLSIFISVILGTIIHVSGLSENIEDVFHCIPNYENLHYGKKILWQRPEKGFLSGTILQLNDDKMIIIKDFNRHAWQIDIDTLPPMMPPHEFFAQERIKIIGDMLGPDEFRARMVSPWHKFVPLCPNGIEQ